MWGGGGRGPVLCVGGDPHLALAHALFEVVCVVSMGPLCVCVCVWGGGGVSVVHGRACVCACMHVVPGCSMVLPGVAVARSPPPPSQDLLPLLVELAASAPVASSEQPEPGAPPAPPPAPAPAPDGATQMSLHTLSACAAHSVLCALLLRRPVSPAARALTATLVDRALAPIPAATAATATATAAATASTAAAATATAAAAAGQLKAAALLALPLMHLVPLIALDSAEGGARVPAARGSRSDGPPAVAATCVADLLQPLYQHACGRADEAAQLTVVRAVHNIMHLCSAGDGCSGSSGGSSSGLLAAVALDSCTAMLAPPGRATTPLFSRHGDEGGAGGGCSSAAATPCRDGGGGDGGAGLVSSGVSLWPPLSSLAPLWDLLLLRKQASARPSVQSLLLPSVMLYLQHAPESVLTGCQEALLPLLDLLGSEQPEVRRAAVPLMAVMLRPEVLLVAFAKGGAGGAGGAGGGATQAGEPAPTLAAAAAAPAQQGGGGHGSERYLGAVEMAEKQMMQELKHRCVRVFVAGREGRGARSGCCRS